MSDFKHLLRNNNDKLLIGTVEWWRPEFSAPHWSWIMLRLWRCTRVVTSSVLSTRGYAEGKLNIIFLAWCLKLITNTNYILYHLLMNNDVREYATLKQTKNDEIFMGLLSYSNYKNEMFGHVFSYYLSLMKVSCHLTILFPFIQQICLCVCDSKLRFSPMSATFTPESVYS
jgi:hypothetical protein